jgi:hypothetical protein
MPLGFFIIIFSFPIYIAFYSKEIFHVDMIIDYQQSKNILVGTAIQSINSQLKYRSVNKIKPDIIAIGTSRVMQFRREYFNDNISFYNAGGAVINLPQYIDFIKSMNDKPQFIIVGLDQYFFNENYAINDQNNNTYYYNYNPLKIILNIFKMISNNKISINQHYHYDDNVGLTAMVYGDGFRKDGSYFYNRIINEPESEYSKNYKYPFKDTVQRIDDGNSRFEYGIDVWEKSTEQVIQLLKECKNNNIKVIAFLPPFAPYINTKLKENGNYQYIWKIYNILISIFDEYDYELYDFTDFSNLSDDSMYIDGFHGDDNTYHNILLKIKENNSLIGKFIK